MFDNKTANNKIKTSFYSIGIAVAIITLTLYWRVGGYDFIGLDDPSYITENRFVATGLTPDNIRWAFTSLEGNWHPLTWLSHQLDVQLFGLKPGPQHLVNLLLHTCNILLLYLVIHRMTGRLWQSAFVAAIFAIHPTHIESVAWLSERKDVLNTLFFLLTMLVYYSYTQKPVRKYYLLTLFCYAFALMSKSMTVTLPLLLLLFDYYPLKRIQTTSKEFWKSNRAIFIEKIPLLLMAALVSIATIAAQYGSGAMAPLDKITLSERITNALTSYCIYIYKFFVPINLAIYYPRHETLPLFLIIICATMLIAATWLAWFYRTVKPYIITSWLFYIISLLPVIGIIQVGDQSHADRYTYIPYIGLSLLLAYLCEEITKKWNKQKKIILSIAATLLFVFFTIQTSRYLNSWQNSITVFTNAIQNAKDNHLIRNHLGLAFAAERNFTEAMLHFEQAITLKPDFAFAYYNKGLTYLNIGDRENAISFFSQAISLIPAYPDAYYNRGLTYFEMQRYDKAIEDLLKVENLVTTTNLPQLVNHTNLTELYSLLGRVYSDNKDQRNALIYLKKGEALNSNNTKLSINIAIVEARLGNYNQGLNIISNLIRQTPQNGELYFNQGVIYGMSGKYKEAIYSFNKVDDLNQLNAITAGNRGEAYLRLGDTAKAQQDFKAACAMGGTQWCGR